MEKAEYLPSNAIWSDIVQALCHFGHRYRWQRWRSDADEVCGFGACQAVGVALGAAMRRMEVGKGAILAPFQGIETPLWRCFQWLRSSVGEKRHFFGHCCFQIGGVLGSSANEKRHFWALL